jgi:hypothetical protein
MGFGRARPREASCFRPLLPRQGQPITGQADLRATRDRQRLTHRHVDAPAGEPNMLSSELCAEHRFAPAR